jgi:hemoglobin
VDLPASGASQPAVLAPVFAGMDPHHAEHVAAFVAEVFGREKHYTAMGGSHAGVIGRHLGRHLTDVQRKRWISMMLDTADEVGLPDDPEFRAAFVDYLEWGTLLAVLNSQDGVPPPNRGIADARVGMGSSRRSSHTLATRGNRP